MFGFLHVMRIYSFLKEMKLYIRASYIVFVFGKSENNNSSNSPKRSPRFLPGFEKRKYFFLEYNNIL